MSGVSSSERRASSHAVKSIPLASAKSLRHARSSEPTLGKGEIGGDGRCLLRIGVCGATRGAALTGDGDRARFPDRLPRRGRNVAMSIDAAALVSLNPFPDSAMAE